MKRLMSLWSELANESASWCSISAARDIETVTCRVKHEGDEFLTITLPQFEKDFLKSLELGCIADDLFLGFKRRGGLPEFLRGFLLHVFDACGTLLDDPCIDCISSIRQLTAGFGKIERPCTTKRVARAMRKFVEIEEEIASIDTSSLKEEIFPLFQKASTLLWADVFSYVESQILDTTHQSGSPSDRMTSYTSFFPEETRREHAQDPMDSILGLPETGVVHRSQKERGDFHVLRPFVNGIFIDPEDDRTHEFRAINDRIDTRPIAHPFGLVPRHGPGATADGLRGNAKYDVSLWPTRLESVFPYGDYALPNWRYNDQLDRVQFLEPGAEVPVKVTPVPKTPKTPRIIAIEPTAMQYAQQSVSQQIVNCLEYGLQLPPSGGGKDSGFGRFFVGFYDQEANRFLARKGSIDRRLATLDLSDASDRVLNEHVLLLMSRFPRLSELVQATRSTRAQLPDGTIVPLVKFASMGSALCFPVEAMVFTTIVVAAIAYERRVPLDRGLLMELRGKVRVYGDDIVVPVDCVQSVIQFLEAFGLKVNRDKSFWNGKFRESCGGDYYDGHWVTPVRFRRDFPRSLTDVDELVSLASYRNLLYLRGYWKTASKLDDQLTTLTRNRWKIVELTSPGVGRFSFLPYQAEWVDRHDHAPRVSGISVSHVLPHSQASGVGALLKFFLKQSNLPFEDKNHLERQGRPVKSYIKRRGIRPF